MSGDKSPIYSNKRKHPAKRYGEDRSIDGVAPASVAVAELCAVSNFSFLHGASHADELVEQAAHLGLSAIAIADRNSFAGVVRAHAAAKKMGLRFLPATRLIPFAPPTTKDGEPVQTGPEIITLPQNRNAYGRLCALLTKGNRAAPKGRCYLSLDDICAEAEDQIGIVIPPLDLDGRFAHQLRQLKQAFGDRLYLAARRLFGAGDAHHLNQIEALSARFDVPVIATNDVLYHTPDRRVLQDVLTSIRTHQPVAAAGFDLNANAERHLKAPAEMLRLFAGREAWVHRTMEVVARCSFSLDELAYEYPDEPSQHGATPQEALEKLTWRGARRHYPNGLPDKVEKLLRHELNLIEQLDYARYFLTVHDIVRFARSRGILCQGRGSAANSAVCFVTGITAVNPIEVDLLFERFISAERDEPPDIDVDFEHERREEVIQYIYRKYGRHRAGIAATVITYRSRSAIREVGKALGLSDDVTGSLSKMLSRWTAGADVDTMIREAGLDPRDPLLRLAVRLAGEMEGFPRHLSQHVGGFVITRGPLEQVMPIHNAAMDDRTFVEWDKDDLDALGMLKIDVLALGMLTCIRKCFDLIAAHHTRALTLATVPRDDKATYDMICKADTVGVFQIESRAQMSMLPRLRPRSFYDLVIEVAIVRPGPIQGDMVHPYLRRRNGDEPTEYAIPALEPVLRKTYGVPLFQEQAMKIAIVGANFTPGEADQLRRAMATFRRTGTIHLLRDKLIQGLIRNGCDPDFAERCYKQIEGFGEYGFPESHAASFALLAYASSWLKCHYPAAFACALLNSQPMGFYSAAQIVRDARAHDVTVLPPDLNLSQYDCTLEPSPNGPALRLGFRQIKGFKEEAAFTLLEKRGLIDKKGGFDSVRHAYLSGGASRATLQKLADADGFGSLGLSRRDGVWAVTALDEQEPLPLLAEATRVAAEDEANLPAMPPGEEVLHDYRAIKLSLKAHPLSFLRDRLRSEGMVQNAALENIRSGQRVRLSGLVLIRQRPGTASGVVFVTLEDETGVANVIVWPSLFEKYRKAMLASRIMEVRGEVQNEDGVIHVVADYVADRTGMIGTLMEEPETVTQDDDNPYKHPREQGDLSTLFPKSRDFH